jgi:hypothetical protein
LHQLPSRAELPLARNKGCTILHGIPKREQDLAVSNASVAAYMHSCVRKHACMVGKQALLLSQGSSAATQAATCSLVRQVAKAYWVVRANHAGMLARTLCNSCACCCVQGQSAAVLQPLL